MHVKPIAVARIGCSAYVCVVSYLTMISCPIVTSTTVSDQCMYVYTAARLAGVFGVASNK